MGHLPPLPLIVHPTRVWLGKAELHGNLQSAEHLPRFKGFLSEVGLEDLGGLLQPRWLCDPEIVTRLTRWEGMQTRMKASKPYLLDLIDLGGKGRKETRNKASVNDGYKATLHSSF